MVAWFSHGRILSRGNQAENKGELEEHDFTLFEWLYYFERVNMPWTKQHRRRRRNANPRERMAFLSPFMGHLLNLIGSPLLTEYARINGISDKLNTWGRKLQRIQAVMGSADERQMNGDPAAGQWLSNLREVAYDMEDLLDHFSVDAKGNSSEVQALSQSSKLPNCLIACCSRPRPRTPISDHRMPNEIEEVDRRLEEVLSHIPILGLVQNPRSRSASVLDFGQPRFATSSLPEPMFVGREKQMKELLARLTGSRTTDDSVRPFTVVSIVGMGGLGKTTLAQELYRLESLNTAGFTAKAWACVSNIFDTAAVTKSILDQVEAASSSTEEEDLDQLQNSLKEKLSGKKFLIVLDNVLNTKYDEVESLLKPFYFGSKGSTILLTTRNIEVAMVAGDPHPMRLVLLPTKDCVSLLAYHSIRKENFESQPQLQNIALQVAKKCMGLPLSIKMIGGLLSFRRDAEQWEQILAHGIWYGEHVHGTIPPALKLCFVHLPIHLKRCFAACALFPKDYTFDQDEVIQLWITQDLLDKRNMKTYREVGLNCLHRLEAVSLLQKGRDDKNRYLMHDLVHDLAKSVVVDRYLSSDEYKGCSSHDISLGKVRHVALVARYCERFISRKFEVYRSMKKLRTFMSFQISTMTEPNVYVSQMAIHDLIMNMKNLRTLSLRCFHLKEVPSQIGELKLLRSMEFSHTEIEVLPESICDMVKLQTLLLRGCRKLKKLPRDMYKLTNLLHLDIIDTDRLEEMPPHIGVLTNLEILSKFVMGKKVSQGLKQLGPLKCIQRELHVYNLLDVDDAEDTWTANLFEKEEVRELSFDWTSSSNTSLVKDIHHLRLREVLQPPRKIESLTIRRYGGKKFPSWLGSPCMSACMNNVVCITLEGCNSVDSLPPFGLLPSLERLDINGLKAVSLVGAEFYGTERPFRSLRSLSFKDMRGWEKWSSDEDYRPFPCLRKLNVIDCPKLKGGCTLSLPTVVEIDIDGCDDGLLKCLADLTFMTKMNISNVPQLVHFDRNISTSWVALEEMRIEGCPEFKSFTDWDGGKQVPPKLKILEISDCRDLKMLPDDLFGLTSLNEMIVDDCWNLSSFPSGGFPPALRKLKLFRCPSLPVSQFIGIRLAESLVELSLEDLKEHVSITELAEGGRLSRSLQVLSISGCRNVTTLPDSWGHLSSLSELRVEYCPTIKINGLTALPRNLLRFELRRCPKVECLPEDMHELTSLKILIIDDCQGMTWLTASGGLPPNLECLRILKTLEIRYCKGMTWLTTRGGLPPNLERLWICGCENLKQPMEEWGLSGLTALRSLTIWGEMECVDEMETFPPDVVDWGLLLPLSLEELKIWRMWKLERLGRGLRSQLPSLRVLEIIECERMKWLPVEDGVLDSLEFLRIEVCPLLEKKCSEGGEYWPIIQLIPRLQIEITPWIP